MKWLSLFIFLLLSIHTSAQALETQMDNLLKQYPRPAINQSTETAATRTINMRVGVISVSNPDFTYKRTGTIDSERGEMVTYNHLLVYCDIGAMAGTHMGPTLQKACSWYTEKVLNDHRTAIGLKQQDGKTQIIATIYPDKEKNWSLPANFWADVKDSRDVKNFLDIVFSYKPNKPAVQ